jgi:hypothetical protein
MQTEHFTKAFAAKDDDKSFKRSVSNSAIMPTASPTKPSHSSKSTAVKGKGLIGPIRRPSETNSNNTAHNSQFDLPTTSTANNNNNNDPLDWLSVVAASFSNLDTIAGAAAPQKPPPQTQKIETTPELVKPKPAALDQLADFNEFRLFGAEHQDITTDMEKLLQSSSSSSTGILSLWSSNAKPSSSSSSAMPRPQTILSNTNQAWNSVLLNDFDPAFTMAPSPTTATAPVTHAPGQVNTNSSNGVIGSPIITNNGGSHHRSWIKSIWSSTSDTVAAAEDSAPVEDKSNPSASGKFPSFGPRTNGLNHKKKN